jgi:PAS domain S-box-containing protein
MTSKPTYEELEQRVLELEKELSGYKSRNGSVRLNQQYLEAILNNTNLPIYLKDADFNYILINPQYERLAQVTNDQIQGKDDFAIFPEPMAQLFRDQDEEVIQRRTLVEFKETVPLGDGVHTFLTAKFPLMDSEGRVYAVGGVCTDITTLQNTKEALRKNEEQYRSFIDSFHGIAYRSDIRTFTPVYFHGAVEQITGYSEEDFVAGAPAWKELVHSDDLPMLVEQGKSMMEIPDYTFKREYRIISKDGETKWIFERGRTLCDENELPVWIEGAIFDITARKIAEQDLRESEEKYRKLFTNDIDAITIFDAETRQILDVNDAFLKLYGYTRDEILKLKADDMSAEPEQTKEAIKKSVDQGDTLIPIRRHKKKDGTEITVQLSAGPYTWKGRTVMYAILRDITSQIKAEKALKESEERYRTLVETASLGIEISDREGRIILSNPAHHKIHGRPEGQIVGMFIWDFLDSEPEKEKLREYHRFIMEEQPEPQPYFTMNKTPDGKEVHIRIDWNYIRDSSGEVTSLCSIITDISAWIWAEQTLKDSERKFRSLIESCPEGIHMYRLEPDGRLLFTGANPAADQILGIDHDQLIGMTIEKAFPTLVDTDIPNRYRDVCLNGKAWQEEQVHYKDNRIEGAFETHAYQSEPGKMAVFFQDVTAKSRMEEELQKMQKLESVGILAGGIAHDFNNLLTAILGNISMAKLFSQTDMNKVLERLKDAENASLRARDLTQQLLTFSKGGAPVKSAASITDIIKDSTSFMLSGSNVNCDMQFQDDTWPVSIDEGQISQVIQNVIKNADQAMPEGGTVTVRAENRTVHENDTLPLRTGNYVHLTIGDQGVGILKKHLNKIFDPYFSTKQEGSGLGLAACYSIIKNHDGLITAESEVDTGTTFHIYLPSSDSEPELKVLPKKKTLRSGEKILIMDDDEDVLSVAVNMLNLMGYTTDTAHDGSEAITRYRQALEDGQPFDGVLLDLTIPGGMGGQETIQQLLLIDPEVKAIVSSGYANDPIMAEYTKYGFHGVAIKPYDMEHLGQILRNLFD